MPREVPPLSQRGVTWRHWHCFAKPETKIRKRSRCHCLLPGVRPESGPPQGRVEPYTNSCFDKPALGKLRLRRHRILRHRFVLGHRRNSRERSHCDNCHCCSCCHRRRPRPPSAHIHHRSQRSHNPKHRHRCWKHCHRRTALLQPKQNHRRSWEWHKY